MPLWFFIVFGILATFIGAIWLYDSRYFIERRVTKWRHSYEAELRQESVSALRDRILKSDYWNLTEKSPLRETAIVKEFFRCFNAEKYDELLTKLNDGGMYSVFRNAERSIGYDDRPMIMDYDGLFIPILKELQRRKNIET